MIGQGFPAVDIEVIHDQMNGSRKRIGGHEIPNHLGKLEGGAMRLASSL
jgi:hypothetical protein